MIKLDKIKITMLYIKNNIKIKKMNMKYKNLGCYKK